MSKHTFLDNITKDSIEQMIPCFKPISKKYLEGETIVSYSANEVNKIAVMLKGLAKLEIFNENGDNYILETYKDNDVFGELFSLPLDNFQYTVTAITDCVVLYIDYNHVIKPCTNLCDHHSQLISNLFMLTAEKTQELSLHISILGQSTIRGKLMAYLNYAKADADENGVFTIPMSLSSLSEYLTVDRSAMMREIRSLKKEGVIESSRRQFKILDQAV